jgi:DNA-binding response OmpR family regulator
MSDDGATAPGGAAARGARILVVEDQPAVRATVRAALERAGYAVAECADGATAIVEVSRTGPDLVILDVGLPDMDGMDVLREIRRGSDLPVLVLTARGDEFDRVLGLELGADDYVVKPFSARELAARVRTILRRSAGSGASVRPASGPDAAGLERDIRVIGDLEIDRTAREVRRAGRAIETTRREFDLLVVLSASPGRVFTREQLLRAVWESSSDWQLPSTVTEHVRRLRLKIEDDPDRPRIVLTVRGVGYRFADLRA